MPRTHTQAFTAEGLQKHLPRLLERMERIDAGEMFDDDVKRLYPKARVEDWSGKLTLFGVAYRVRGRSNLAEVKLRKPEKGEDDEVDKAM